MVNETALTEVSMEGAGMVCYAPMMITSKGAWLGDNPLHFSVPLFLLQLIVIISTSRLLHILLKPFRQPRAISEILCGIILGPSVLGRSTMFLSTVFPLRSLVVFDTMANIGLVYNFFLVGVEMDLLLAFRLEKRVVAIAFVGMILPFAVSCSCSYVLGEGISPMMDQGTYIVFVALVMSISAFPLLSRILVELKILHLEIGRLAMVSSFINDVLSWIILVMIIVLAENKTVDANHIWVILSSAAFVLFCILFIRPAIWFLINKTPEGESYSETSICLILTGVMISGYITEAIGTHAIVGAFVFGLVIPNGPLAAILIEKLEDFVTGILLPLYYASSGLKSKSNDDGCYHFALILVTILACAAKIIGTLLTAMFYKMPLREAATLGFLMNAKGLTEMVALNLGFEHEILDGTAYAIMVFASAIMIGITIPIVTIIYKPARKPVTYRGRAIDRAILESELRILVAIHTSRNVPIIINLLEASSASIECPLSVYVLHLAELTGRASAMLNVSATQEAGAAAINKTQSQSDHIIKEFSSLEQQKARISVQHLAAISPYSSMHEDICTLAETKQVAFIIIPFHQQQTVDGEMTSINPDLQKVNQNVLENAVCSVGILIDRGLSAYTHSVDGQLSHHIGVLFFGGPDDREALAYAMRLAQHPSNRITVIRFLPGKEAVTSVPELKRGQRHSRMPSQMDKDIQLDDEYIQNFRTAEANNVKSLIYAEKMINNSEETVAAVKSLDSIYDLFMVGRRQGTLSVLTEGLTDWSETPELGAIGDLLVSPDFPARVSILVVQHFIR